MKLVELARALDTTVDEAWASYEISGLSTPIEADEQSVIFLSDAKYREAVELSRARVVIAVPGTHFENKVVVSVKDPYVGFARAGQLFEDLSPLFGRGRSPSSFIDPSAQVDASVSVGPLSVVGAKSVVGKGTVIGAGVVIENGSMIGRDCRIDSGAVIRRCSVIGNNVIIQSGAVIGSEGFGNAREGSTWVRIPHFGNVIIEDGAEIGANTTIDRGALGATTIGKGVKIDNLVMIAHNVTVGENSAIAAQTGIAGSTKIGRRVILAGNAGFVGHIEVGDDAFVGAKAGVSKSVPAGGKVTGYPARDIMTMRRIEAAQTQLPNLLKEVRALRKRIEELEKNQPGMRSD